MIVGGQVRGDWLEGGAQAPTLSRTEHRLMVLVVIYKVS
jgi:hypothetical protein